MSIERRKLLRAYGAQLVLTPKEKGMAGAVEEAERIAAETPDAWIPQQFQNPSNPAAHYRTTGPEIEAAVEGFTLGAIVAGVGTGGTISGAGKYLKERLPNVMAVAVEPAESPIIAQTLRGEDITPGPHQIQGIGANFIPGTLDLGVLDAVEHVTGDEAIETARTLAVKEAAFVGISSGAAVAAALRLAAREEFAGKVIIAIAPSTGERYLSTKLWEGLE